MENLDSFWMTVPQWPDAPVCPVFHREQAPQPPAAEVPRNVHALIRAEILLPEGESILRLSADDYYHAWLDGKWLGCGPEPAYPGSYPFRDYPVIGGRRVVLALHIYYQGLINRVWNSGDGRFGFYLRVLTPEGEIRPQSLRCCLCTAYSGDIVGYDTQFLENFDSRLWPEGWNQPDHDDSGWETPVPASWADYTMEPAVIAPLTWTRREPVSCRETDEGLLLDFGRECTGMLTLQAAGQPGQRVRLRFAEELLDADHIRYDLRCGCRYEEYWTLGEGACTLHPFDYKAFRYVAVLPDPGVTLSQIALWERHYPMEEEACTLISDADDLGAMFEICKNAVRCGTQEGYLDCPTREKGQYLGDAVITARSQLWLTGKPDMLRKCMADFRASLVISPGMMAVAPGSLMQEIGDFSLLFPMLPLTDYAFTGEREQLAENYPAMVSVTETFAAYARADGLLENVTEQWNLVDWPENLRDGYDFPLTRPIVGRGCHNVINALWYGALRMRQQTEDILGLPHSRPAEPVAESFRQVFFRPEQRLFADSAVSSHCSLHANLYAAFFGLLPEESADAYEALLCTPGRVCGVMPMYYALTGLARMGKHGAVYRLLTRQDAHGWRNMLREGATACLEAWGKEQKWNTSLCHPWASSPISILIEELAGFHPDPGAPEGFRFAPAPIPVPKEFCLTFPFRGKQYQITPDARGMLQLERMNHNAHT